MKHTVHVTVTMSVEVDTEELKKEFGKITNKLIREIAVSKMSLNDRFDTWADIVETKMPTIPRKGIGSY